MLNSYKQQNSLSLFFRFGEAHSGTKNKQLFYVINTQFPLPPKHAHCNPFSASLTIVFAMFVNNLQYKVLEDFAFK